MGQSNAESEHPIPNPNVIKPTDLKKQLLIATWNIRRGLVVRELELKNLLKEEKIDVIFLTETDTLSFYP